MSSPAIPPSTMHETYWLISERLDSNTPLGRDSVPEVYINRSGSSSATAISGAVAAPCCHQRSTSSQPSTGPEPERPITPRIPPVIPAEASAFSAAGTSLSSATSPRASEWLRM